MGNLPPQRVAIIIIQLWYIFKVCRALRHQSALAKERNLRLGVKPVFSSEFVHVRHKLIFRNADERILNLAGDILGHRDDALLVSPLVAIAAIAVGA
jgi:hypothetical protein